GNVYVPEIKNTCPKKHPCKDCFACEFCSDDRCRVCRRTLNSEDTKSCHHPECHCFSNEK
ncbi:MAG: hypothetical protein KJ760_10475, partial [Proteobacteria bacterium]|nr:hypothetical protein [Pseudomonadota bacterium]